MKTFKVVVGHLCIGVVVFMLSPVILVIALFILAGWAIWEAISLFDRLLNISVSGAIGKFFDKVEDFFESAMEDAFRFWEIKENEDFRKGSGSSNQDKQ
jgi:hypothetical protein